MLRKHKTVNYNQHRGRIQAQGGGVEESEAWAQNYIPYKSDGHDMIDDLKLKLSMDALKQRKNSFERAEMFIDRAPSGGWDTSRQSYPGCPPHADVRVDVEIIKGKAFKDNQ